MGMRGTGAIRERVAPGDWAGRSRGCGAPGFGVMVGGGAGGRVERRGLGAIGRRRGLSAVAGRVEVGLTAEAVEGVAQRVAQLLRETERREAPKPMTAGQLAHHLQVGRAWVYRNRRLLGGWRINDGPKAQWRFDPDVAMEAFRALSRERGIGAMVGA
jgi:hypothetical protein